MSISCQKICDCTITALVGLSLINTAVNLASNSAISLPIAIGSGLLTVPMFFIAEKIATMFFDFMGWQESPARSCAQWVFATICAIAAVGSMLSVAGVVCSVASGIFSALRSMTMTIGGICGLGLLVMSVCKLLDPNYAPRSWNKILNRNQ